MEDIKSYYFGDPFAFLLRKTFRLHPIVFALIAAVVSSFVGLITSWYASWESGNNAVLDLFLQDWKSWIWRLFLTPVIMGYYLWIPDMMNSLIREIKDSGIVKINKCELKGVTKDYRKKSWRMISYMIISLVVAAIVSFIYFKSRMIDYDEIKVNQLGLTMNSLYTGLVSPIIHAITGSVITIEIKASQLSWTMASPYTRLSSTIIYAVAGFVLTILILSLLTNFWTLRKVMKNKDFDINLLHHDQCGGLKFLGLYSLKIFYLFAAVGMLISLSEYNFITRGLAQKWPYWILHLSIPLYFSIALLCFFAPLIIAHDNMKKAKEKKLDDVTKQYWDDYKSVHDILSGEAETIEKSLVKMQKTQSLYEFTKKLPAWPFDLSILRKLLTSLATAITPTVIALLKKLLDL